MSLVLCILDGWGHSTNPKNNAIYSAKTPNFDRLWKSFPHSLLKTHGSAVGLPEYQMGNSEVGHMTIGAGKAIDQDLPKINKSIATGNFQKHPCFEEIKSDCHVIGCISDGGVHSHIEHIIETCKTLRNKGIKVILHAITDGRDTPPKKAHEFISMLEKEGFKPATICGRFYSMDRDNREERTAKAFDLIVNGQGLKFDSWKDAIDSQDVVSDEFLEPMCSQSYKGTDFKNTNVIICNFRADRVRQITAEILKTSAKVFTMTEYNSEFKDAKVLFPRNVPRGTIGEQVSNAGLKQLRLAETEKYAHVTYFFNGGREEVFPNEDRKVIPSPKDVKTYDLKPEMSAHQISEYLTNQLNTKRYDFICVNFANTDMVGHSGNFDATVKAVETVDEQLGLIMDSCSKNGYDLLITADHGNAESMWDSENDSPLTAHSKNPVPLIYMGDKNVNLIDGELGDIAKIVFELLEI